MRPRDPISLSAAWMVVVGCSAQAPPPKPVTPLIYDLRSEGTFPDTPDVAAAPTSLAAQPLTAGTQVKQPAEDTSSVPVASMHGTPKLSRGWSVQVFAGVSKEVAVRVQQQLQAAISEPVYLDYLEPYYKVRVGDCGQRAECDTLQQRLRALGSDSAWVVPRRIESTLQP